MKSHGIDFVGKLWIQRLPTKPAWTTGDVGRVFFAEDVQTVYVGGRLDYADWIAIGQMFKDTGTAIDPIHGGYFTNRLYSLTVENGNMILTYEL